MKITRFDELYGETLGDGVTIGSPAQVPGGPQPGQPPVGTGNSLTNVPPGIPPALPGPFPVPNPKVSIGAAPEFIAPWAALRTWYSALEHRDTAAANAVFIGDSITEGQAATTLGNRWVEKLGGDFRDTYEPGGYCSVYAPAAWGTGQTLALAWTIGTPSVNYDFGWGRRCNIIPNGSASTMTISAVCTGFDILYAKGTVGTFGYTIDGGSTTSVNAAAGSPTGGHVESVRSLAAASHTVVIRRTVDGAVSGAAIEGIIFYNGNETSGVHIWEAGHGAADSAYYVDPTEQYWVADLVTVQPQLVVIHLGTRDYFLQTAVATFKANITTLVTTILANCTIAPSIVIVAGAQTQSTVLAIPWLSYTTALQQVAVANGVGYLDITGPFGGYVVANTVSDLFAGDFVHPTDAGHALIADVLFDALAIGAQEPGGLGTVTSVALTVPAEFSVSGSPITGAGTLAVTKANESANTVWAGPTSGSAAAPTFRALVAADIPAGSGQTDHQHVMDVLMNGDGSTTAFELPAAPFDAYSVAAYVAGTLTEVTLSGTMLTTATFGSAPTSGTNNVRFDIVAVVV